MSSGDNNIKEKALLLGSTNLDRTFSTNKHTNIGNDTNAEEKTTTPLFINELKVKLLKIN